MHSLASIIQVIKQGRYHQAIAQLSSGIDESPEAALYYWRAYCHYALEDFAQAIKDFSQAIAQDGQHADWYYMRALAYHKAGHKQEALADLDHAALLEPDYAFRYASRAFIKAAYGMIESAIQDYERAIDIEPGDAINHNNLGLLYEQLGMTLQASFHFQQADSLAATPVSSTPQLAGKPTAFVNIPKTTCSNPNQPSRCQIIKEVFTSKARRKEFIAFLRQFFLRKKKYAN